MNKQDKRSRLSFVGLVDATGLLLLLTVAAAFAGRLHWTLELTTHFRPQYTVLLGLFTLWSAVRARRARSFVFAVLTGYHAWLVAPFLLSAPALEQQPGTPVKLLLANVNAGNTNTGRLLKLVADEDPDLLLLLEVSPRWAAALRDLEARYPHRLLSSRQDNFGIALLSRLPLRDPRMVTFGEANLPSVLTGLQIEGVEITFLGTHPLPPVGREYSRLRDDQLATIAAFAALVEGPLIIAGDLNASPWSPAFRDLAKEAGVINSAEGRGLFASWPAFFPPLVIPIDHLLHSREILVAERLTGPKIGSDHRPQIITFKARSAPRETSATP